MMQGKHSPLHAVARSWSGLLAIATLVVLLAACGGSGSSTSSSGSNSSTSSGGYGSGGSGTTPTAGSSGSLLKTATATVKGSTQTILVNAQGMTLYHRTSDKPPATVCSGGCASAWPPLLASGSTTPTSATSLPGKLSVLADANGNQVAYNGHPLYTFASDTAPGQTSGEGVGGVWFVATPTLS